MSVSRACDVCHMYKNGKVLRYILSRSHEKAETPGPATRYTLSVRQRDPKGKVRSWGAGSIDLCDECWEHIAKPRMRPLRKKTHEETVRGRAGAHAQDRPDAGKGS